jgi:hypothetical protein
MTNQPPGLPSPVPVEPPALPEPTPIPVMEQVEEEIEVTAAAKLTYVLGALAFGTFVVNGWLAIAYGTGINFTGPVGATVIMFFLAGGTLAQAWKLWVGHQQGAELLLTWFLLVIHLAVEAYVVAATQFLHINVHTEMPIAIIVFYWLSALIELNIHVGPRELRLFRKDYESPQRKAFRLLLENQTLQNKLEVFENQAGKLGITASISNDEERRRKQRETRKARRLKKKLNGAQPPIHNHDRYESED